MDDKQDRYAGDKDFEIEQPEIRQLRKRFEDAYNLIGRQNENHYFIAKIVGKAKKHLVSDGDMLIQETVWVPFDKAVALYKEMSDHGVSGLVKQRETPKCHAGFP